MAVLTSALLAASGSASLLAPGVRAASTLAVPATYPTIQAAIAAAADGDTVVVAPGTYNERIDFLGKNIVVQSQAGRDTTVIDGGGSGVVVKMAAAATATPTLRGFTIRNGGGGSGTDDGAIDTSGGPALIENNLVTANHYCGEGAISAAFSAATIRGNIISANSQSGCSGGVGGGAIAIRGAGTVQVVGNTITGNSPGSFGGAIALFAAGSPVIDGNVISGNTAGSQGGAIDIVNASNATITNNVFASNSAPDGGAIYWLVPSGERGPIVANNTFIANTATRGSAVFADGYDAASQLTNDLVVASGSSAAVYCGNFNDPNPPVITFNDVVAGAGGTRYGGICADQTGLNGNVSAAPTFVNPTASDYHLANGSAGIDAGTATNAPARDIDGDARPLDGNGDGLAVVDIGADEAPALPVSALVDILPGTSPNVIKLTSTKTITVAILTTPTFSTSRIDPSTVCFGSASNPAARDCSLSKPAVRTDVDRDGDVDLSLVFDTKQTGIAKGDTQACLTGRTFDGQPFQGCDSIVTR